MGSGRIVMLTPCSEPVLGGITTFLRGLTSELRRLGADVRVLSRQGEAHPGVEILEGTSRAFMQKAAKAIKEIDPDAIHAHGHWYTIRAGLRARAGRGAKLIFTFHTRWDSSGIIRKSVLQSTLRSCDFVTFPSRHLIATMNWRLPSEIVRIIPPGTEEPRVDAAKVAELRANLEEMGWDSVVGYVGQFQWPEKVRGFEILLEALARPELENVGLAVVGDGLLLGRAMEKARRLGVDRRVLLLGQVQDPHFLYAACDVYCHPSLQEGLSLAVLEAMRNGAAVVAFRGGSMEEILTHGQDGLIVDATADALAAALSRVFDDRGLATALGQEARKRAATDFSWSQAARAFLALYGVGI